MKKLSFLAAATLIFALSCNVAVKTDDSKTEEASSATIAETNTKVAKDPVCGMEKDSTWTEYTVTGTDTAWFCSPHCKETFAKSPEKYLKKENETKG